jgi:hypothetical protein
MRPIIFTGESVRAILDGRKTQTRRVINSLIVFGPVTELQRSSTPGYDWTFRDRRLLWNDISAQRLRGCSTYGAVGDRLWVREGWGYRGSSWHSNKPDEYGLRIEYKADAVTRTIEKASREMVDTMPQVNCKHLGKPHHHALECLVPYWRSWRSPLFMHRWASRITLEILTMRVERLQDIDEADAIAEGVDGWVYDERCETARDGYRVAWDKINGKRAPWASNPWVWAIEFKVCS